VRTAELAVANSGNIYRSASCRSTKDLAWFSDRL
jgi:hypothetical protein